MSRRTRDRRWGRAAQEVFCSVLLEEGIEMNEEKMREAFEKQHPDFTYGYDKYADGTYQDSEMERDFQQFAKGYKAAIAQGEQERELLQQELRIKTSKVAEYSKWHDQLVAERIESQRREAELRERVRELRDLLFDVVNELDLSDAMVEEHGPLGTPPAELVRLVLEQNDQQIKMLKHGFVSIT